MTEDPLYVAKRLGVALEQAGARWAVGGSVASSVHGIPRSTLDLDVIVALSPARVGDLAAASVGEFEIDEEVLREQLRHGRSYNIFHTRTMTKVDLFPAVGPFERNQLDRSADIGGVRVIAAEDSLLAKLDRALAETSGGF